MHHVYLALADYDWNYGTKTTSVKTKPALFMWANNKNKPSMTGNGCYMPEKYGHDRGFILKNDPPCSDLIGKNRASLF